MPVSPTQGALVAALALSLAYAGSVAGEERRSRVSDRLIAGVPWGTLVTIGLVAGFYLFAQSGLSHPESPVVYPFVSWSYLYPTGILTAGIAHGSLGHVVGNLTATLALAPIAEYVWGHYPARTRTVAEGGSAASRSVVTDGGREPGEAGRESIGTLARPWVRAVVLFPAALLALALATSAFSLGPGLGFSGAVYGVVGFAVVARPLWTVVGVVAASAASVLFSALREPVVRETLSAGPPSPPSWAGVGFQAHLLGFLIGVLLALALLAARDRRPDPGRVFAGAGLVGLAQSVWLVTGGGGEEYVLYRGAGVAFLSLLVVVVAVAAGGSDRRLVPRFSGESARPEDDPVASVAGALAGLAERLPDRASIARTWLLLVALGGGLAVAVALVAGEATAVGAGAGLLAAVLLALPALPAVLPGVDGPLTRRRAGALALVALALLVSVPTVALGLVAVDDPSLGDSRGIEVRDYTVAYVEDEPIPQTPVVDLGEGFSGGTTSGLVVTSDDREFWTLAERPRVLAHDDAATVVVGGVGWREAVAVDRVAWDVVGNGSAVAVDLAHDDREVRSFAGGAVASAVRVDGHGFAVVPTAEGFAVRATAGGERVAEVSVPESGEAVALDGTDGLSVRTVEDDDSRRIVVAGDDGGSSDGGSGGGVEAVIAERGERV